MKQETKIKAVRLECKEEDVLLKINVGNGHPSLTTIFKNGSKLAELKEPYSDFFLAKKKDLIGSDILITTSVHDLAETPDKVMVSHVVNDSAASLLECAFEIKVDDCEVAICSSQLYFLTK